MIENKNGIGSWFCGTRYWVCQDLWELSDEVKAMRKKYRERSRVTEMPGQAAD